VGNLVGIFPPKLVNSDKWVLIGRHAWELMDSVLKGVAIKFDCVFFDNDCW
jgi:hypothetical protein